MFLRGLRIGISTPLPYMWCEGLTLNPCVCAAYAVGIFRAFHLSLCVCVGGGDDFLNTSIKCTALIFVVFKVGTRNVSLS
jgi:hypothetical protein